MDIAVKRFITGPIDVNTYVVSCGGQCLILDPSSDCGEAIGYIKDNGWTLHALLLTHGHFDHILGINEVLAAFPSVPVLVHTLEVALLKDPEQNGAVMLGMDFAYNGPVEAIDEGRREIGPFAFSILHIPGHSPGGCAYILEDQCFSGDAIFAGSIGRTDFPNCDHDLFMMSLRTKLLTLPDTTVIWPGHGGRTTIGREKRNNPFL